MSETRSVTIRLTAETAQYIAAMTAAGKSSDTALKGTEQRVRGTSQAFDDLAGQAGKVGAAAAGILAASAKAAVDWESAWTGVTKTVDGTAAEMAELEGQLREMARTLPATHQEIAAVAEAAGQLGIEREGVAEFTKTMIALGETTNLTADDAATSIAQIANVMGTSVADVDNLGAALVALGNDGASTEAQIIDMAQRISGAGAQIGLAESDILAIANAAASMGIEVEAGGTAISRVFVDMAKATAQGGEQLKLFSKVADVSSKDFVRAFEADPAQAFALFTKGLDRINKSGGDVFTTLDQLKLSDVRVSRALLSMAASGDLLTDSLDLGAEAWEENTALTEEFAKRLGTTESEVRVAWNNIKDAGIEMGQVLLPIISDAAAIVADLAAAFGSLPQPVQTSVVAMLGITAVLGGGLWFTAKTINAVHTMTGALSALTGDAKKARAALIATRGAAAIGGAAIFALSRSTEAGGKAFDTLGSAALGAGLGFAVGGPWGAAIGAGAGALYGLTRRTEESGEAFEEAVPPTDQFVATLDRLTGAATTATRELAFLELQKAGALQAGQRIGIAPRDLVGTTLDDPKAWGRVHDAIETTKERLGELRAIQNRGGGTKEVNAEYQRLRDVLNTLEPSLYNTGRSLEDAQEQARDLANATAPLPQLLRGIPRNIITQWENRGAPKSLEEIAELAGRIDEVSNKQIKTLIRVSGIPVSVKQVREFMRELDEADKKNPRPEVGVDGVPGALSEIGRVRAAADALDGKRSRITIETLHVTTRREAIQSGGIAGGVSPGRSADGSSVPDDGGPYTDRFLYLLAPGEEIITNRHGEADRFRADRAAGRIPAYADGGTAGIPGLAGGGTARRRNGSNGLRDLADEAHRSAKAIRREREARQENLRDALQAARSKRGEIAGSVRDRFRSDIFATDGNVWSDQAADPIGRLNADIRAARQLNRARKDLQRKGLGGTALSDLLQNADLGTVKAFAGMSRRELDRFEDRYRLRQQVTRVTGRAAGEAVMGAKVDRIERQLARVNRQLSRLAKDTGKEVASGVNGGARRGAKRG